MQLEDSIHCKPLRAPIVKGLFYSRQDTQKPKGHERLLPFVTTYHLAVKNFKTNTDGALESDTQLALSVNNFYKTSDHLLQKGKIPLRHACESKYII